MSLKDQILSAPEPGLSLQPIVVTEWNSTVYLKGWSGKERERFEKEFGDLGEAGGNVRAKVLVRVLKDESGNRIFEDADADALGDKLAGPLNMLFKKIMDLSGLRQVDADDAKKN